MATAAEREFFNDIRSRKSLVPSARRRRRGSKTTYCGLPSDHLTTKQWKERNGAVMTYNMRRPMTWREFKQMPADLQKQYLLWLSFTFQISRAALADMFGCVPKTVDRFLEEHNIDMGFARGRRMTEEQRKAFNRFRYDTTAEGEEECADGDLAAETAREDVDPVAEHDNEASDADVQIEVFESAPAPVEDMRVHELSLMLDGYFGDDLAHKIMHAAGSVFRDGTPVRVGLRITTVVDKEEVHHGT